MNVLVLQVIRQDPPAPIGAVLNLPLKSFASEVRLFPPTPADPGCVWPPQVSLDLGSLPQYITRQQDPPALQGL